MTTIIFFISYTIHHHCCISNPVILVMNDSIDKILLCTSPKGFLLLTFICGGVTIFLIHGGAKDVKPLRYRMIPYLLKEEIVDVVDKQTFKSPKMTILAKRNP